MTARKTGQMNAKDGMFIYDAEIIETQGADVLAVLDADPRTQKGKGTRPAEARYRPDVEKKLASLAPTAI